MKLTAILWRYRLVRYAGIMLGCLIASCSINLLIVPSHLLTGGASGVAIIFYDLPIGLQTFAYNIPLLFAAYRTLGRAYTMDVVLGTMAFSFCLDATRFLGAYAPVQDPMLGAIFGGVANGIGYGIVFRMNGSTGGFDIVAAIVRKYYSLGMGGVIFAFNCVIVAIAGALFGVEPAMLTLVSMYVNAHVTDSIIAGFNRRKAILVVSQTAERIAEAILDEVGRGVTFLHGQGAYTRRERDIVLVVVSLTQIAKIKLIVHSIDEHAFMIIIPANEVMGRGFTDMGTKIEEVAKKQEERAVRRGSRPNG